MLVRNEVALRRLPEHVHHPASRKWLSGTFAQDLENMANGISVQDTSLETRLEIAKLALIPVAETSIEAKHSLATKRRSKTRGGLPVQESLANRRHLLLRPLARERDMTQKPFMEEILRLWDQVRTLKAVPKLLGLSAHPAFADSELRRGSSMYKLVTEVLYRTDLESQYRDFSQQQEQHCQNVARDRLQVARALGRHGKKKLDLETVKLQAMLQHWRMCYAGGKGAVHDLFSLPVHSAPLRPMQADAGRADHPSVLTKFPGQPVSALVDTDLDMESTALRPGCFPALPPQECIPHAHASSLFFRVRNWQPSLGKHLRTMNIEGDALGVVLHEVW